MKRTILALARALPMPALAQQTAEDQAAYALILPMIQEMLPGYQGQVIASCTVAHATPEEKVTLASAPGPSVEVGQVINGIVARPAVTDCVKATLQQ